jgi:hypothetical protein
MFSLRQEELLYSLRPAGQARIAPQMDDRRAWASFDTEASQALVERAERALRAPLPHLTAGDYLRRPDAEPPEGYKLRRLQAMQLILGACVSGDEKYLPKAADLIWMMAEESSWAAFPRRGAPLPAFGSPDMDLHAARTADLFALARQMVGQRFDRMTPQLTAPIDYELRRRAFDPIIARDSEDWMHLSGDAPRVCQHLMAACLAVETDEGERRWQILRRLLKILEGYLRTLLPDGGAVTDLKRHVEAAAALGDCFALISLISGGEVELRDEPQFVDMAILPCKTHIADGWFVNPGGDPRPDLSPEALFRLGEGVRSGCLCGMAAWLRRQNPEAAVEGDSLFTQLMYLRGRANLNREPARLPLPTSVLLPDMGVAIARSGDFFAALTGGDRRSAFSHKDAGDVLVYYRGAPILVDSGLPDAGDHNVPAVEGVEQNAARRAPEPPELRGDGYWMLTMGIAHAYPAAARLYSWQRSLMLTPGGDSVRLIDAYDFEGAKKRATFRFITPFEPVLSEDMARLGPVALRYPAGLAPKISPIPLEDKRLKALWGGRLYRLELTTSEPAPGARLDFTLSPADAGPF